MKHHGCDCPYGYDHIRSDCFGRRSSLGYVGRTCNILKDTEWLGERACPFYKSYEAFVLGLKKYGGFRKENDRGRTIPPELEKRAAEFMSMMEGDYEDGTETDEYAL